MEHYLFCPKCRGQFRDWVEVCPQCRVHLVHELPDSIQWFTDTHFNVSGCIGMLLGGLTLLVGGVGIVPEGIIGVHQRSPVNTAQLTVNVFAMASVVFVSALLISPDPVYRRYWIVICVGAVIAVAGGAALFWVAFYYPPLQDGSLAAAIYVGLAFLAGVLASIDSVVLCGRLLWARWAKRCPACGTRNPLYRKYCEACGTSL